MLSWFQAAILGAVQGLTEFLPISSSAHLAILPWMLHWDDPGLAFDVALHLGTLVALLIYYRRQWTAMCLSLVSGEPDSRRLLLLLVIASVPGALIGVAFEHQAETIFRSPLLIAVNLAALGMLLWGLDWIAQRRRTIGEMSRLDALLIGLSQALAVVPGVSRSGATITMARVLKMTREDAANFSFLMAAPIIAGAGMIETPKLLRIGFQAPILVGFATSALFGWIAIFALLNFVRTRSYAVFAWYRLAIAALIAGLYLARA